MLTITEIASRANHLATKWRTLHSVNTSGDHHVKIEVNWGFGNQKFYRVQNGSDTVGIYNEKDLDEALSAYKTTVGTQTA